LVIDNASQSQIPENDFLANYWVGSEIHTKAEDVSSYFLGNENKNRF